MPTPCRNTTVCRTTSEDSRNQGLWILQKHFNTNSCRNNSTAEDPSASEPACLWPSIQSSVRSFQATQHHHCRYPFLKSSLLGAVAARCASAACCTVLNDGMCIRCARPNMLTHTLSKQRSYNSSDTTSQEQLNLVKSGAVMTSSTSATTRKSFFRNCTSATSATHFKQRAVVTQRLRNPTKPLCGPMLPAMHTPQVCNHARR